MTFYNISKITKDLIWINSVKNVGIHELVYVIDGDHESQGEVVAITKTKIIIRTFVQYNFSNQTKVLFVGETKKINIPTNVFGRLFDSDLQPLDGIENNPTLNYKNGKAKNLNRLFLTKPNEIIFESLGIFNGGFYDLDLEQAQLFLEKVETRNKFFVFCKIKNSNQLVLNLKNDFEFGEPTIINPKNEPFSIINSTINAFALCEYLTFDLNINTILIIEGIDIFIKTKLDKNSKDMELIPNIPKITESQIRLELNRNLYLKNEKVGLTVILV